MHVCVCVHIHAYLHGFFFVFLWVFFLREKFLRKKMQKPRKFKIKQEVLISQTFSKNRPCSNIELSLAPPLPTSAPASVPNVVSSLILQK